MFDDYIPRNKKKKTFSTIFQLFICDFWQFYDIHMWGSSIIGLLKNNKI